MPQTADDKKGLIFKQSSELEILISAAIVFAAFKVLDIVPEIISNILNNNIGNSSPILIIIVILLLFLSQLLPISIVTHFILRFYWLSLVGLKTAFDRQRTERLNYAERYMVKINEKEDLDKHIEVVDKICSSIFAFSFLAVFVFCCTIVSISLIVAAFMYLITISEGSFISIIPEILINIFVILCLVTFIDFITLGALKRIRKKWFVKVYYPISRFMGYITFFHFYKGLYYTFITNIPKKLAVIALPAYLFVAIVLLNAGFYESKVFATETEMLDMEEFAVHPIFYKENFNDQSIVQLPFIETYHLEKEYLTIYIPLTEQIEDSLLQYCKNVIPLNDRGFHWRKWVKSGINQRDIPKDFSYKENARNILSCFAKSTDVYINDSLYTQINWKFHKITAPEKNVLITVLDVKGLSAGEHTLKIKFNKPLPESDWKFPFYKVE